MNCLASCQVNCTGNVLSLSEQCHGIGNNTQTCNYFQWDEYRNEPQYHNLPDVIRSFEDVCNDNR